MLRQLSSRLPHGGLSTKPLLQTLKPALLVQTQQHCFSGYYGPTSGFWPFNHWGGTSNGHFDPNVDPSGIIYRLDNLATRMEMGFKQVSEAKNKSCDNDMTSVKKSMETLTAKMMKLDNIECNVKTLTETMTKLDNNVNTLTNDVKTVKDDVKVIDEKVDSGFDDINEKVNAVDEKVNAVDEKVNAVEEKMAVHQYNTACRVFNCDIANGPEGDKAELAPLKSSETGEVIPNFPSNVKYINELTKAGIDPLLEALGIDPEGQGSVTKKKAMFKATIGVMTTYPGGDLPHLPPIEIIE